MCSCAGGCGAGVNRRGPGQPSGSPCRAHRGGPGCHPFPNAPCSPSCWPCSPPAGRRPRRGDRHRTARPLEHQPHRRTRRLPRPRHHRRHPGLAPAAHAPLLRRHGRRPLPPDTPQRLAFDLLPTSALFRPGDRVRLTLAPANPSSFEPRPAAVTALSWWEPRRPRRRHGLTVRVALGRERPDYSPCQAR
ncbi:CocE/NonD family hydrolase C-terminal non-catalytic domain-containing protein [Kitasatospora sp. NPDC002551]|uniref:CocE/NonD family hydrolase C-terminal non-catalytic domain-containing protein n=1 Tax=Kitasatospora sp. NPDC002551 TaxID=3154539 RepID=UPI003321362C